MDGVIDCTYTIETRNESKVLKFDFEYFTIKNDATCTNNYMKIWDGTREVDQLLTQKCGEDSPGIVLSTKRSTMLQYKVQSQALGGGFYAKIMQIDKPATADCGSTSVTATSDARMFKSSGQGNHIPYKINCKYEIRASNAHMFVKLKFLTFKIDPESCEKSFVKIYNGDATSEPLKTGCGSTSPGEVKSTGQLMTIVYEASKQPLGGGFQAMLKEEINCGETNLMATDDVRTLQSAAYGADIPSGINCTYTITANQPGKSVNLQFTNFKISFYSGCENGWVKIWDGSQTENALITKKCRDDSPGEVTSQSEKLIIEYVVDSQALGEGFVVNYKEVTKPEFAACDSQTTKATSDIRLLKSSGQGNRIPFPIDCKYKITTEDEKMAIILNFIKFNILQVENCANSFVKIYNGDEKSGVLLKTKCGSDSPGVVQSTGKELTIWYKSSQQLLNGGFEVQLQQVKKPTTPTTQCNQMVNVAAGQSKSINVYEGETTLSRGQMCLVSIKTDAAYQLNLTFSAFNFKGTNGSCTNSDYLQIGDGLEAQSGAAKMCGSELPNNYVSSKNEMFISYIISDLKDTKGFKATVTSVSAAGWTKLSIQLIFLLTTYFFIVV